MKNCPFSYAILLFICMIPMQLFAQFTPRFQAAEGIVIIEIESGIDNGSWGLDTTKVGYTGAGYLKYNGPDLFNSPGQSLLKFEVAIEKTGKYRFQWHSRIAVGTSNTEHNDSWLRFKDASDFYGQKNDEKVYPKGTGKTPNPEGSSKDGWMKIYQNVRNEWTWQTRTSDRDPHDIFVEFDSAGIYTLEVSGRSNGHAINRLALYHVEVSSALALDLTKVESERIETVSTSNIATKANLKISPTLARDFISFEMPNNIKMDQYELQVFNLSGQLMRSSSIDLISNNTPVNFPIDQLSNGYYVVLLQSKQVKYQGRFIKQ